MAVAAVAELTPTVAVTTPIAEALAVPVVAVMAAALATAAAPISTARRELQTLVAVVEEQILNQLLQAMVVRELSSCVTLLLPYQPTLACQQLVALLAPAQR